MTTTRSLMMLATALMVAVAPGLSRGAESSEFEIEAGVVQPQDAAATGGEFALEGEVANAGDPLHAELELEPSRVHGALKLGSSGCGCLGSSDIFADGFETGDLGAWSTSVP